MRPQSNFIMMLAFAVTVGGPLLWAGLSQLRRPTQINPFSRGAASVDWRLSLSSALLYTLAFNVIFFLQELFLVLPKAFISTIEPVLYHNNHDWMGENPLVSLFQGMGALVIFLIGLLLLGWLSKRPSQTVGGRLFLIWLTYHGLFESIPQLVAGAFLPQNDVGMAMDYLHFSQLSMNLSALIALCAMISIGLWLTRPLLALAGKMFRIDTPTQRVWAIFQLATLPGLLSILLIFPFRMPGTVDQVVLVPVAVTWLGISWIQANAWHPQPSLNDTIHGTPPIRVPIVVLLVVLLVFHLILRPGIRFHF